MYRIVQKQELEYNGESPEWKTLFHVFKNDLHENILETIDGAYQFILADCGITVEIEAKF